MTATLACTACGVELVPSAKFCSDCGTAVSATVQPAEYKQVTVLFADVVRSMDIATSVGAERLREIMTELVERSAMVVRRYGGTVDKFTGDGVMAVFGAPVALEDHALRACLAALGIQQEVMTLAAEVDRRDGVDLRLRIGVNSGQVVAGEVGSGAVGYTAIGEQVGMAQRMESVAPPGGVMLSESTARLVESTAVLGDAELVHIKGVDEAVCARRLLGVLEGPRLLGRAESELIGRRWEMSAVDSVLGRAADGHGAVIGVVGPPGIGKSRLTREVSAIAGRQKMAVVATFCESHTSQVPFHVVARLLRAAIGVENVDGLTARARLRDRVPDADPEDLLLLDDLLGVADPDASLPAIDPDARRRRLTALLNAASLARETPTVYVVEDAHWIDEVSESMLADFFTVIPQTPSLVLVTYRPEYEGALTRVEGAQTIALAPLSDSETAALVTELLGPHSSNGVLRQTIGDRAAGNPFFAEEIVRELAERGVLKGQTGAYVSTADVSEAKVPATLQATIAARIDRLEPKAKRTLCAAAVVGSRFRLELLDMLDVEPAVADLLAAKLIDQVRFTRQPEFVFHHPLIRAVAYEAQLKSDRAEMHRRLAAAIEAREPDTADQNAALIAEHLEAAGDGRAAYGWHMRAATWATNRDINSARQSWEHARRIADALPEADPDRTAMCIAPHTMLCGIAWRVHDHVVGARFDELRDLCTTAGDEASLAIGMAGLVMDHAARGRLDEASQLADDAWAVAEQIGDPTLMVGVCFPLIYAKMECAEWFTVLQWSQTVIDLADGDATRGNFIFGSPLAAAFATRGLSRYFLGRSGWQHDFRHGIAAARQADPMSNVLVFSWIYNTGTTLGVLRPDDRTISGIEDTLRIAERSGDDLAVALATVTLGDALVHRLSAADRSRGENLLAEVSDVFLRRGHNLGELPIVRMYLARERSRRGDLDEAISLMSSGLDDLIRGGQLLSWGVPATSVLVETLLDRGTHADVVEAQAACDRLAAAPTVGGSALRDIWVLRMQTLLARARGDTAAYAELRDRYRETARSLEFAGHIDWAEAMDAPAS